MDQGFVIFVVRSKNKSPCFLEFYSDGSGICYHPTPELATVYPILEAAEVVVNELQGSDEYLLVKVFDTEGNPCSDGNF